MAASQAKLQEKQMSLCLRIGGCLPLSAQVVACPELSLSPGPRNTRPPATRGRQSGGTAAQQPGTRAPGAREALRGHALWEHGVGRGGQREKTAGSWSPGCGGREPRGGPSLPREAPQLPRPPQGIKSDTCPSGQS